MKNKPVLLHVSVFVGLAGYLVLFHAARLPSVEGVTGGVFRRFYVFRWMLLPEELLTQWCGSPPEFALVDRLPVLAVAGVIVGCALGVGWLLMWLCRMDRGLSGLEVFVFSTAVGLNVISTYVLLVGLLGLLDSKPAFAVPAAFTLAAVGWTWIRLKRKGKPGESRTRPQRAQGKSPRAQAEPDNGYARLSPHWLWLAVPFVVVTMLGGMLPPVEFDVREYHLQVPKEFFQQGYVGFLPHNVYGNMPMGTEMLSLLAMVIAGDWWLGALAGKTVIATFAPLTALGLLAAGRRFFCLGAGVVAAILYVSIPWIVQVSSLGLVEGASACYLFLAVYAVLLDKKKRDRFPFSEDSRAVRTGSAEKTGPCGFLLLAGYLAGGAVSCKYPAVLFVLLPLGLCILFDRKSLKNLLPANGTRTVTFLLAAAVGCGLWFGKNWALAGNPTYPLLYGVFKGEHWTPEKDRQWNNVHRPKDFSPQSFVKHVGRVGLGSEWLSPLVVPLAALALLVRARRRLALVLLMYFGYVIVVWWLFTHRIDRFWIPALPLLALLAGAGACWSKERIWQQTLVALLIMGSLFSFLVITSVGGGYNRYFVGLTRLRRHPERVDPWHRYFNTSAPCGRVLVVGDAQVFDLEVPILYNTCFDDSIFEQLVKDRPADQVRAELTARGISHVYVHWGEIDRYRRPGNYGYTDFVQPAVFDRLVDEGLLEALPEIEGHPGQGYRVVSDQR